MDYRYDILDITVLDPATFPSPECPRSSRPRGLRTGDIMGSMI